MIVNNFNGSDVYIEATVTGWYTALLEVMSTSNLQDNTELWICSENIDMVTDEQKS